MSGIQRFLSKREKRSKSRTPSPSKWRLKLDSGHDSNPKPESSPHLKLFSVEKSDSDRRFNVEEEDSKIKELQGRLSELGVALGEPQIRYALRSKITLGDINEAYDLLTLLEDSLHGVLRHYSPSIKLLGAENRNGVTCYLDSLLFAMFARLDCFEAILYNSFEDEPRRNLTVLLRLWVNLLRTGKLITTDLTQQIQEALAQCGWQAAALLQQQDVSEAFTFITEKLDLPLLTLKMDIFHTGREEAGDDHKFVNERLLEVAIPAKTTDDRPITLEDCLENYFNNRIDVKRFLERNNTANSVDSVDSMAKGSSTRIETVDLGTSPQSASPLSGSFFSKSTEVADTPSPHPETPSPVRPNMRLRSTSIIRERFIPEDDSKENRKDTSVAGNRARKGSIRKEVMMPAWQIFSLIPWYTDSRRGNNSQSAIHFSSRRPILGICLKRYSVLPNGNAVRLNTFVDIPIEIGLPHFIQDDDMEDEGPLYGNFKLSLQAVICHRGNSVESGHYIALVRGTSSTTSDNSSEYCRHWMRFDDLARERITLADIEKALSEESPYLLFYRILPIESDTETTLDAQQSYPRGEIDRSRKLFSNPNPEVTVSAPTPLGGVSEIELYGAVQDGNADHRVDALGASANDSHNPVCTRAKDESSVGGGNKSSTPSRRTSISKKARSRSREGFETGDENTSGSGSGKKDKTKHAKLSKEKTDGVLKQKENHRTLRKGGDKLERECILM
ncbi:hypothetical protein AJ79_08417 [Helicocarpus griseus UAMH5409]|uniref:ubiquitinyl hydrolase 1 n=1 Tax=Helicocarpus griseus UAMH5409 TaxID=1447875 RepID=A0A2B7WSN1_9EURO|nr:hypothetical protein AJ79_08417 [Helicocarpus griseus UAMH5409]